MDSTLRGVPRYQPRACISASFRRPSLQRFWIPQLRRKLCAQTLQPKTCCWQSRPYVAGPMANGRPIHEGWLSFWWTGCAMERVLESKRYETRHRTFVSPAKSSSVLQSHGERHLTRNDLFVDVAKERFTGVPSIRRSPLAAGIGTSASAIKVGKGRGFRQGAPGMPQVSAREFERLPLRVHEFLHGVPLHDVWAVDLPHTRAGITLVSSYAWQRIVPSLRL